MMKSNTLFECGSLYVHLTADVIHVVSVSRPFPFFATLPLPCITLQIKMGSLGTRLPDPCLADTTSIIASVLVGGGSLA